GLREGCVTLARKGVVTQHAFDEPAWPPDLPNPCDVLWRKRPARQEHDIPGGEANHPHVPLEVKARDLERILKQPKVLIDPLHRAIDRGMRAGLPPGRSFQTGCVTCLEEAGR